MTLPCSVRNIPAPCARAQSGVSRLAVARWAVLAAVLVWALPARAQIRTEAGTALVKGIEQVKAMSYTAGIATLRTVPERLPLLADYASYYLGLAYQETGNSAAAAQAFSAVLTQTPLSPYFVPSVLAAAGAYNKTGRAKEAITLLKQHYGRIPQARVEAALGDAFQAVNDPVSAAVSYQKVYYYWPNTEEAADAAAALAKLRLSLGEKFPPPMSQAILARSKALMDGRRTVEARKDLLAAVEHLAGSERDVARVRLGAVDLQEKKYAAADTYLRHLTVGHGEADAERLYHLVMAARRLDHDQEMLRWVEELNRQYPDSPWRMEALISASYPFLARNESQQFEPLYSACAQSFASNPQSALCHWKWIWSRYLNNPQSGEQSFKDHLRRYPDAEKVPASLYFLARIAENGKDPGAARVYYSFIDFNFPNHFYATLARERMQQQSVATAPVSPAAQEFLAGVKFPMRRVSVSFQASTTTAKRLERTRLLATLGLADLAESELRFSARQDGQPQIAAVELAKLLDRRGAYDEALRALKAYVPNYLNFPWEDAPVAFWRAAFPMPYRELLERHTRQKSLDPYVVAGLIRQESEFNPKALSPAKAHGLTQVMPSTGRQLSRQSGMKRFTSRMLFEPDTNLRLGTLFMRQLLDSWKGRWEEVLASYNAGPSRVKRWITWASFREPAEFIETIPINETRDYVQIVLRNAEVYRRLYAKALAEVIPEAPAIVKPVSRPAKPAPALAARSRRPAARK